MRRTAGLSLIEILIAMAVLTILVTAVGYAISGILNISKDSRINVAANDYSQAVIERYRTHWSDPQNYFSSTTHTFTQPDVSDLSSKLDSTYKVTIDPSVMLDINGNTFTQTTPPSSPPVRKLTVTVERPIGRIRARIATIIGSR